VHQRIVHQRVPSVLPLHALAVDVCAHRDDRRPDPAALRFS
jgi:hypothetical protein